MTTVGNQLQGVEQKGIGQGLARSLATVKAASDAAANVSNATVFTNLIKKAEDSAQSSL